MPEEAYVLGASLLTFWYKYFATIGVADDEMQMDKQQFYSSGSTESNK